jgi:hypothetical protein
MASTEKQMALKPRADPPVSPMLYHRESSTSTIASLQIPKKHAALTKTPLLSVSSATQQPQLDGTRIPPRPPVPYPMTGPADLEKGYPHWMAGFCKENSGDGVVCCQAVFCPCYLYGKTEWRIKRFSKGENGFDEVWEKSNDGCNSPCIMQGLITCFPFCKYSPYVHLVSCLIVMMQVPLSPS